MVNAVHPGLVATDLYLELFTEFEDELPQDAAATIVYMASSPEVEIVTGEYFMSGIPIQSSYNSYTKKYQKQLWELSERLTGIESSHYIAHAEEHAHGKKHWHRLLRHFSKLVNKAMKHGEGFEYNVHRLEVKM